LKKAEDKFNFRKESLSDVDAKKSELKIAELKEKLVKENKKLTKLKQKLK